MMGWLFPWRRWQDAAERWQEAAETWESLYWPYKEAYDRKSQLVIDLRARVAALEWELEEERMGEDT